MKFEIGKDEYALDEKIGHVDGVTIDERKTCGLFLSLCPVLVADLVKMRKEAMIKGAKLCGLPTIYAHWHNGLCDMLMLFPCPDRDYEGRVTITPPQIVL